MTKADIVSEIAKDHRRRKGTGAGHRRGVHGEHQDVADQEQQRLSPRLRQLHREKTRQESGPQHLEEYDHYDPRTQHPRLQAGQELRSEGEIGNDKSRTSNN